MIFSDLSSAFSFEGILITTKVYDCFSKYKYTCNCLNGLKGGLRDST